MQHRLVTASRFPLRGAAPAVLLAAVAWLVLIVSFASGTGAVVRHDRLLQGGPPLWLATIIFVAGWQVMVATMMVPSSLRAFARAASSRSAIAFTAGYLATWTAFGLAIFYMDAGVHWTVNHWPWLAEHPWLIAGTTLVVAGTYQLSDLKVRALSACRQLAHLEDGRSSVEAGLFYAVDCIGVSWGLMLLAFALSAGSLAIMVAITLLMVWEITPWSGRSVRLIGYASSL